MMDSQTFWTAIAPKVMIGQTTPTFDTRSEAEQFDTDAVYEVTVTRHEREVDVVADHEHVETLADQARRKGFTRPTHSIGDDLYPLVVRPNAGIPQGWIILDELLSINSAYMNELEKSVNEYVKVLLTDTTDQ